MEACKNSLAGGLDNHNNNIKNSKSNSNNTDSSMHLSTVPSFVRLMIFKMCGRADLQSLSLCSKWLHDEVVPILWMKLMVSWHSLQDNATRLRKQQCTSKIHLVSNLQLHGDGNGELLIPEKERGYISYGFGYFLQCCEEERVKSLKIHDFLPANGLRLVCETFHKLRYLQIQCIHDANWDNLSHLPASMEHLSLHSCTILKQHWETICRMENLKSLEISWCDRLTSDDFGNVEEFKLINLIHLDLTFTNVNDEFIATVCNVCSKLTSLQLNDTDVTDMSMAAIAHMPALRHLCMANLNHITDRGIFFLSKMQALVSLVITFYYSLSPECLKYVGTMKSLKRLFMSGSCMGATDEDFAHIGNLTSLTAIEIPFMHKLTNASLELISTLQRLEHLDLGDCLCFTNDGLEHLAKLPLLRSITLELGMNITMEGLESCGLKDLLDKNMGPWTMVLGS